VLHRAAGRAAAPAARDARGTHAICKRNYLEGGSIGRRSDTPP
jgi:hypothetical protein